MFKKYSFGSDLEKRISRARNGYGVTLPARDALRLYYALTPEDEWGYIDLVPMFAEPPKVDDARFYTVYVDNGYVFFGRNRRLSPDTDTKTLSPAERRNKAYAMACRGLISFDYVDNMPTR